MLYGDGKRAADDKIRNMYMLPADATEDTRAPDQRACVCHATTLRSISTLFL